MPLSSRRTAGAQSRKAGEAWEEYVSARWLTPALRAGMIRRFDKLEPKKVGPHFLAAAGADYVGCRKDGRYFAIECKQTKDERFRRSEVSAVQVEHLDSVECSFRKQRRSGRTRRGMVRRETRQGVWNHSQRRPRMMLE